MDQKQAARSVLIEIVNILGAFRDEIVIVGGWVPDLKYPDKHHIGSLDVDLAISPTASRSDAYSSILARLSRQDYTHKANPTRFYRCVPGVSDPIKVDLITGQYVLDQRTDAVHVDGLSLNALRGVDLAFEAREEIRIDGTMPDGTSNTARAWIVRPEAFILIKAFALAERAKEKDAYDIAFVIHHYDPSLATLAACLAPMIGGGLGSEAYGILAEKFATYESVGPVWAARVAEENGLDRERAQRAAFEDAQELFAYVPMRYGRD